jgi:hypothetical protein
MGLIGPSSQDNAEIVIYPFAGVPVDGTSGTFAGNIRIGGIVVDVTNANIYINAGTVLSPVYKLVTRAA